MATPPFPPPPQQPVPWGVASPPQPMTAKAMGRFYHEFTAVGWTDDALIREGYMGAPIAINPPRPLKEVEEDLARRLKLAAEANQVAKDAQAALTETRNELRNAAAFLLGQTEAVANGDTLP